MLSLPHQLQVQVIKKSEKGGEEVKKSFKKNKQSVFFFRFWGNVGASLGDIYIWSVNWVDYRMKRHGSTKW